MAVSLPHKINFQTPVKKGDFVALDDGNFMAIWSDQSGHLYRTVLKPDGTVIRGQELIASGTNVSYTELDTARLSDGRIVVTWKKESGSQSVIEATVLDKAQYSAGATLRVSAADAVDPGSISVFANANSGASVFYTSTVESGAAVYSALLTQPNGGAWQIAPPVFHHRYPSDTTFVMPNGTYVRGYAERTDNGTTDFFCRYLYS
ncbi:hypothetical protein [Microvirga calopogonii]|uniref:hypothetical protein n=1 Tax=Microvirga calopogonii TaxID=2078013 RepID=UPI000E0DA4DB|nr:hypothetical protein [Microvirga calopogonii]